MLCRETPHRLPGSCLPGCPRPVPPGPTSLLLWGSELLGSSGGQDPPGSLAFPIHPHRLLLRSPVGWGPPLHPHPHPRPVLVCRVSLPTLGDTPTPHALPGQLVPARPYPRARVSALLGALEGPGSLGSGVTKMGEIGAPQKGSGWGPGG